MTTLTAPPPETASAPAEPPAGGRASGEPLRSSAAARTMIALLAACLGIVPLNALLRESGWLFDAWFAEAKKSEPNNPDGRTSSTTKMIASGTSTLRSEPIASTYVPARVSVTPMIQLPTTAPTGDSKPPSAAPAKE